jgi:hypothetical protein
MDASAPKKHILILGGGFDFLSGLLLEVLGCTVPDGIRSDRSVSEHRGINGGQDE